MKKYNLGIFLFTALYSSLTFAQLDNSGLLDQVLQRYQSNISSWETAIRTAALFIFWSLALISVAIHFGFKYLFSASQADFSGVLGELLRFFFVLGFFFWILNNAPAMAMSVFNGLRQLAGNASNSPVGFSPSEILDIGFLILDTVLEQSSIWSPIDSLIGIAISLIILVILALIGIQITLQLITGWFLAYAGILFVGFGGSSFTSDIAITYIKNVIAVGARLMAMVLLVGIASDIVLDFYSNLSSGVSFAELAVVLIVAVTLYALINSIPNLLGGIITGSSLSGASSVGGGALTGALAGSVAGLAAASALVQSSALQGGGALAALNAAFGNSNTQSSGGDINPADFGISGDQSAGSVSSDSNTGGSDDSGSRFKNGVSKLASAFGQQFNESVSDTFGGRLADKIKSKDSTANLFNEDNQNR